MTLRERWAETEIGRERHRNAETWRDRYGERERQMGMRLKREMLGDGQTGRHRKRRGETHRVGFSGSLRWAGGGRRTEDGRG